MHNTLACYNHPSPERLSLPPILSATSSQWIFLKLFKAGLAYKTEMPINWCTSCKCGLANEEVVNGVCDRCFLSHLYIGPDTDVPERQPYK